MAAILRATFAASIVLAVVAVAVSAFVGQLRVGLGLGAGLVIGSANGFLMRATVDARAPFVAGSFFRLALLTGTALIAAFVLHVSLWAVALGVAVAQLVWTAISVREGLRQ